MEGERGIQYSGGKKSVKGGDLACTTESREDERGWLSKQATRAESIALNVQCDHLKPIQLRGWMKNPWTW